MTYPRPIAGPPTLEKMSGAHKVTALLLAMGKPLADRIIKQFEDREIRALARTAMELPSIDLEVIDLLVTELSSQLGTGASIEGSSGGARALLDGVVSEDDMGEIMGELSGQPPSLIWKKLKSVADDKLYQFISGEQPQVAAYVISKLEPDQAAAIIDKLDPELRANLSMRLLGLKPISDAAIRLLAERLASELLPQKSEKVASGQNYHAQLGAILNKLDRSKSVAVLDRLASDRPDDARKVRKFIFSFEDVIRLTPEDRGRLFEEAPTERIVRALRNCEGSIVVQVLATLSPRVKRLVESELANPAKVPNKLILDERRAIADTALALAERSIIALPTDNDAPANIE